MSLFTTSITPVYIPYFGHVDIMGAGVLINLLIQALQVALIGIKFYPILVVADAEPYGFIYLLSTLYIFFIWVIRFFKRSFCSRTEAFITQMVRQFSSQIGNQIKSTLNFKYNSTNTVFGLFTDEANPNEKYISAMKDMVPSVFKEYFGRYSPVSDADSDAELLLSEDVATTPSSYYVYSNVATTQLYTTTSYGLRDALKNKTITKVKSFRSFFIQRDQFFATAVLILENLPLYVTLSYLLVQYGLLFLGTAISWLRDIFHRPERRRVSKMEKLTKPKQIDEEGGNLEASGESDHATHEHRIVARLEKIWQHKKTNTTEDYIAETVDELDGILYDLNKGYTEKNIITEQISHKNNHNYCYIQSLFADFSFIEKTVETKKKRFKTRLENSYFVNLFETYVYKKVPYMKYSKQFVNTYTVGEFYFKIHVYRVCGSKHGKLVNCA